MMCQIQTVHTLETVYTRSSPIRNIMVYAVFIHYVVYTVSKVYTLTHYIQSYSCRFYIHNVKNNACRLTEARKLKRKGPNWERGSQREWTSSGVSWAQLRGVCVKKPKSQMETWSNSHFFQCQLYIFCKRGIQAAKYLIHYIWFIWPLPKYLTVTLSLHWNFAHTYAVTLTPHETVSDVII